MKGREGQGPGCGESRVLALELRHHLRTSARAREGFLCVYVYEGLVQPSFFLFCPHCLTCRVIVPRPEIEPASSAVGARSLNC